MELIFFLDNSNVLIIRGMKDHLGVPIVDAVVTVTLMLGAVEVFQGPGEYLPGTEGDYDVPLPADLEGLTSTSRLVGTVLATSNGLTFSDTVHVKVRRR